MIVMLSTLFWIAITALATVVVALIAVYQSYLFRVSIGVDILLKMEQRFESKEVIDVRKGAVKALRKYPVKALAMEDRKNLERILSFFETLGLLVHQGSINKELAWNSFFHHFYGYCVSRGSSYIAAQRKKYGTRYTEIFWLANEFDKLEKRVGGADIDLTEWDSFLDEEESMK